MIFFCTDYQAWKKDYEKTNKLQLYQLNNKKNHINGGKIVDFFCSLGKKVIKTNGRKRIINTCIATLSVSRNQVNQTVSSDQYLTFIISL